MSVFGYTSRDEFFGDVRHIITAIGMLIAARGGPSAAGYTELVVGLGMIAASIIWSRLEKRSRAMERKELKSELNKAEGGSPLV